MIVEPHSGHLTGSIEVPGDKSISHRALVLSALAEGDSLLRGLPAGQSVLATRRALEALGVEMRELPGGELLVRGVGLRGLGEPSKPLDCKGSATTARLLAGALAGAGLRVELTGDEHLSRRPMSRVIEPLTAMGAEVRGHARGREQTLPIVLFGRAALRAIRLSLPLASAQVKSCVLLAGLRASGRTEVTEPAQSRDHTETMLAARGARIQRSGLCTVLEGPCEALHSADMEIPGDPSSAAFPLVGAVLSGGRVRVEGVCLNPTRVAFVDVLRRMGARLDVERDHDRGGEPAGKLEAVGPARLSATIVEPAEVPALLDEIPILAVAAAFAKGETRFEGCGELRFKETDRIAALVSLMGAMGVEAREEPEAFVVRGTGGAAPDGGGVIDARGDHRVAMAAWIMALRCRRPSRIIGAEAAAASFPEFPRVMESLRGG